MLAGIEAQSSPSAENVMKRPTKNFDRDCDRQCDRWKGKKQQGNLGEAYRSTAAIAAAIAIALSLPQEARSATLNPSANTVQLESLSTTSSTVSPKLARQFQRILDRAVEDGIPPGMAVGIISPQGTWFGSSGFADVATGTPVRPSDRFLIGSITKTFTAATILKLAEEGELSLEDTLGQWLPEIAARIPEGESITLRQLLNGTSGIYDFLSEESPILEELVRNPFKDWLPQELVAYAYGKERSASWVYPNTGFILAGAIAQKATGSNIAQLMRDRILNPLGLENTFFKEEEAIPGGFTRGYGDLDGDGIPETDVSDVNLSWGWAAGALVSNTDDLLRFSQVLFNGELLSQESFQEMSAFNPTGSAGLEYGLGLYSVDFDTFVPGLGTAFGHGGGTPGHNSQMFYFPEQKITVVALQNSQPPNDVSPLFPIFQALQKDTASVPEPNAIAGLLALGMGLLLTRTSRTRRSRGQMAIRFSVGSMRSRQSGNLKSTVVEY